MTNRAEFKTKRAPMFSDFGEFKAREWFGDDAVDRLPQYVKGDKKGRPKGWLVWERCVKGGWVNDPDHPRGGRVAYPGEYMYRAVELDHSRVIFFDLEGCVWAYGKMVWTSPEGQSMIRAHKIEQKRKYWMDRAIDLLDRDAIAAARSIKRKAQRLA